MITISFDLIGDVHKANPVLAGVDVTCDESGTVVSADTLSTIHEFLHALAGRFADSGPLTPAEAHAAIVHGIRAGSAEHAYELPNVTLELGEEEAFDEAYATIETALLKLTDVTSMRMPEALAKVEARITDRLGG